MFLPKTKLQYCIWHFFAIRRAYWRLTWKDIQIGWFAFRGARARTKAYYNREQLQYLQDLQKLQQNYAKSQSSPNTQQTIK